MDTDEPARRVSLKLGGAVRPVIGMVHLRALPGAPTYGGSVEAIRTAALRDAEALQIGGASALLVENYFDAPFYPNRVPAHTVAHMTAIASALRQRVDLPLGVNVLRNDGRAALAVAHAAGADFIRVNVLVGARMTDQGILEGRAHRAARALVGVEEAEDRPLRRLVHVGFEPDADAPPRIPAGRQSVQTRLIQQWRARTGRPSDGGRKRQGGHASAAAAATER